MFNFFFKFSHLCFEIFIKQKIARHFINDFILTRRKPILIDEFLNFIAMLVTLVNPVFKRLLAFLDSGFHLISRINELKSSTRYSAKRSQKEKSKKKMEKKQFFAVVKYKMAQIICVIRNSYKGSFGNFL